MPPTFRRTPTISTRAQYLKPGDMLMWLGWLTVEKVEIANHNDRVTVYTDSRGDYRVIYLYANDNVTIKKVRKCHPCFDSDCECIWDVVAP